MTIPNRTVAITGVFAEDALTTIPATPVPGTSYRDTAMTTTAVREGWAYKTIVDSAQFNQALFEYSSVTAQVEKYGFLPWSSLTDYVQGSVCLGSDGVIYQAKQATGPSSTAYDPTTNPSVWQKVTLEKQFQLFQFTWLDYNLQDTNWICADTFSWQDGTVYTNAYNHLVDEWDAAVTESETINGITITYRRAADGHKIVPSTYEQYVIDMFNATGVAWYYIIDTVNQKFKLPRTKFGFTGLRDTVGNYVPAGLPNITAYVGAAGNVGATIYRDATGAFYTGNATHYAATYAAATTDQFDLGFDASRSSGIYGKSSTVQPPATQMYLYFYIGQFSQSATEQTAGITTAQLNAKVDLDAGNLSSAGKSTVSGLGMPGDSFDSLTLLASGQTYTLTENGYICLSATFSSDGWLYMYRSAGRYGYTIRYGANTWVDCCLYGKKGTQITIQYNGTPSVQSFRFIPAEGEE